LTHWFDPTLLRDYDMRGTVGETLDAADAWALGRSFGTVIARAGGSRIAVGYDGRLSSPMLEEALVDGLCASGIDVLCIGVGPTPMLYYAEMGVRFTSEYGDIDEPFYNSMESMYEAAALFVTEHKIGQQYQARFEKMVADTSGIGWGFHDQLTYLYEKYFSTKGRDVGEQKIL